MMKSTPYPSRHPFRRRGFAKSPREASKKKTEKRKRCARANARTRTHQRPPRGVNTRSKRVFMLFARNNAHSFPLKPSTTPLRSAEICPPTHRGGLGLHKRPKMSRIRAPRATTRTLLRRRRSILARYSHHFARTRSPFNRTRRKRKERERERDVPIVYRFWTACFFCRNFCAFGGSFFSFFFPPSPSPLVSSFAAKNTRES
jgi:hypothetical protein